MDQYQNLSGTSGVDAYMCGPNFIAVQFRAPGEDGANHYLYDSWKPGATHVERMQELARSGRGLNTYIDEHVKDKYSRKGKNLAELKVQRTDS